VADGREARSQAGRQIIDPAVVYPALADSDFEHFQRTLRKMMGIG
jgi:hypothetical protein